MKHKTYVEAKATLVEPTSDKFKVIASMTERYGLQIKPQIDLLYIESCLVSAGTIAGINDNDDIFTREDAWAARHTPVLKPLNWQHTDKDIIGVMYSVQARDLNGNILDFDQPEPPDIDFDLWTEAVIFKFINQERAKEVERRSQANNLFVSMEAWFDDYHYGICNADNKLSKVISRDKTTAFLDKHLRAYKGSGEYDGQRIGRVLKSITFGGCGVVDRPANKRSKISIVKDFDFSVKDDEDIRDLINLLSSKLEDKEEVLMSAQASHEALTKEQVKELLDERERLQAQAAERKGLEDRTKAAEEQVGELEQKVSSLSETIQEKEKELNSLNKEFKSLDTALDNLMTEAGATSSTPSEIGIIDNANKTRSGDAVWQAKLSWIKQSLASFKTKAEEVDSLKQELEEAARAVREDQVRSLFKNVLPEDTVNALVAKAQNLTDEDFEEWFDEKKLLALDMSSSKEHLDKEMKDKKKKEMQKEEASDIRDLITKRMTADAPTLVNPPHGGDVQSGVSADELRRLIPRHKVAGSADGDDLAKKLENVQVDEQEVDLTGASQLGDEDGEENPFATLASIVTGNFEKDEKKSPKEE